MSFFQKKSTEGKSQSKTKIIKCPICSESILYMNINSHIDRCSITNMKKAGSNEGETIKPERSLSSILNGKRKLSSIQSNSGSSSSTAIDINDKNNDGDDDTDSHPDKLIKVEERKMKPIQAQERSLEQEIKHLQKNMHLPLSERLRPKELREYVGQQHILSNTTGTLYKYIQENTIPSMILWGPPGVGKTSLARLLSKSAHNFYMIETSATKANTQELRSIFEKAKKEYQLTKRRTVLFIDEIHRFNKSQQDLLLPHVENGDVVLIGATTENPSFQLNNALISRCHVFVLQKLTLNESCIVLSRGLALLNKCRKLVLKIDKPLKLSRACLEYLVDVSMGDTRRTLNLLEMIEIWTRTGGSSSESLTVEEVRDIIKSNSSNGLSTYYDPKGDNHYDTISAFHKAIRGGDENASLYYLARMIKGGEDPLYIARRMIRIATEDVGLRDPTQLPLAVAAHDAVMKIGLPEADLALAECCVSLARAPKSIELYRAWNKVKSMINENLYGLASSEIPMHIRNAPTKLMEDLGYHEGYKYNPEYKDGLCKQQYWPNEVLEKCSDIKELKFLTGKHFGNKRDPDLERR
ncbi:similar to Saccharomyces cerevisiae YNL218W MGS1 Protein with DNA-dependent ATPase and ssDNA annealing activities involved in maintenance of genome [Maudiozyma saulgeensis]|uniref:Similar to Saccharomyces cerevisiae YNL218W MGS1 Protein with DNA-dependent ATPase and ssDNA annealing activities involved in maintenance of genome n=1 Tax=Maudiozyma saulgeensis TaxID=1789683 RepID=A0A1X7R257_9SACH|nr:similar to Saccharomyces cerevisiae YNL218W MGS1 Protein with DNA-dependent ATPase and ssDNA annealing activities involved in maintenance of genome [Kazachstania saulgeensis]